MFVEQFQPEELERLHIRIGQADTPITCTISQAGLSSGPVEFPLPDDPLVDAFGQWIPRDWPGKVTSLEDLQQSIQKLENTARSWPDHFSGFGGDQRVQYEASGFFRVGAHKDRPCLIDPEGHPFWSTGVDCVNPGGFADVVAGTEHLYAQWPNPEIDGEDLVRPGRWDKQGIDFGRWNLRRVYGENWRQRWDTLIGSLCVMLALTPLAIGLLLPPLKPLSYLTFYSIATIPYWLSTLISRST